MKFKNVFLLSILFIFISTTSELAEYSYSYGNQELNYADNCAYSADQAYLGLGFTSAYIWGYPFSQSAFLTNASVGNAVYAYTHGSFNSIADNLSRDSITTSEVSSNRASDWKRLVFLDACDTAYNSTWASAWGISNGDGDLHAFIGWQGLSYDSATYYSFTSAFFSQIKVRSTIGYSLVYAGTISGVSGYGVYGSTTWSY